MRFKYDVGLSHAKIARACGLSKGVVSKYVSLAQAAGISWQLPDGTDEAAPEARPYKPKGKVEAGVLVERWILARLRHHTFFTLASLNQAIRELLEDLNRRPPGSRG